MALAIYLFPVVFESSLITLNNVVRSVVALGT